MIKDKKEDMEKRLENISNSKWHEKIKALRIALHINKSKMADLCCTYRANYHAWETGKVYPRKDNQYRIAKALKVRISDIFSEE